MGPTDAVFTLRPAPFDLHDIPASSLREPIDRTTPVKSDTVTAWQSTLRTTSGPRAGSVEPVKVLVRNVGHDKETEAWAEDCAMRSGPGRSGLATYPNSV